MQCDNTEYQYQTGGSLPDDAPSYVTRDADQLFYEGPGNSVMC